MPGSGEVTGQSGSVGSGALDTDPDGCSYSPIPVHKVRYPFRVVGKTAGARTGSAGIGEVAILSVDQPMTRDLVHAREDARWDLTRCRHRLASFVCARELSENSSSTPMLRRLGCRGRVSTLNRFGLAVESVD